MGQIRAESSQNQWFKKLFFTISQGKVANSGGMKKKAVEAARKMKVKNYPTSEIIEITGLTEEQINNLR